MPKHLMIDLETLDTRPSSVVLSIGAIAFDPESGWVDTTGGMEVYLKLEEQFEAGRTISESTFLWWFGQSDLARNAVVRARRVGVEAGLDELQDYCSRMNIQYVWSNGAAFDVVIMEHLMNYTKMPWKFYKVMDMRTIMWLNPVEKEGETEHTALADAVAQVKRVNQAYRELKNVSR